MNRERLRRSEEGEPVIVDERFVSTRFDPRAYIEKFLRWTPWTHDEFDSQQSVIDQYVLALRQQFEKAAFESGELREDELEHWSPGQQIRNWIRIAAGHNVGKTKLLCGLINHFFDSFAPAIIYTYAPTWEQIRDLLWKEIKTDRGDELPGRVLETCEIKLAPNHFARGRALNNAGGQGTERAQGQHGRFLMMVVDEAEATPDYLLEAIKSMTSGGVSIVLLAANPRTRTSTFHRVASRANVANFRISCVNHPNVEAGREIIPGAVGRDYVDSMIDEHCEIVDAHDPDSYTFELPWRAGVVYKPDGQALFRVFGIAPTNLSDRNLISTGRFEAATKRTPETDRPLVARIGVDAARYGTDFGTVYVRWNGRVWRSAQLEKLDTLEYVQAIKRASLDLFVKGVRSIHVRVDAGGGFGAGVVDSLKRDGELLRKVPEFRVFEVHFNGSARDKKKYYDAITEWTADVAESLKGLAVIHPANELESDLCDRQFDWVNEAKDVVKKLEDKKTFYKRVKRSPDDGDGFVLACVSDFLISPSTEAPTVGGIHPALANYRRD